MDPAADHRPRPDTAMSEDVRAAPPLSEPDVSSPTPADDPIGVTDTGFRNFQRYTYWSIVSATLVLLLLPALTGPVPWPPDPLGTASLVAVVVVMVALVRLIGHHIPRTPDAAPVGRRERHLWTAVGGIGSVVVAAAWMLGGDPFLWAFAPAMVASLALASLPRRHRHLAAALVVILLPAAGAGLGATLGVDEAGATVITAVMVTGFAITLTLATIWSWRIVVQLNDARQTAATLAVANERLRFAADLHDIQGHNLQVIALKSELAARLLRQDLGAAEAEVMAVQELASDALLDTRAVVQGYRRASLSAEISNASTVLDSAGIATRLQVAPRLEDADLPETDQHLLGLVVREAVTNVLRHSTATRAEVSLSADQDVQLLVANDGVPTGLDDRADGRLTGDGVAGRPTGGGLDDLAERLHHADGSLAWGHVDDRFEVRARLPFPRPVAAGDAPTGSGPA